MISVATALTVSPPDGSLVAGIACAIAYLGALSFHCVHMFRIGAAEDGSVSSKGGGAVPITHGMVAAGVFAGGFGTLAVHHLEAARRVSRGGRTMIGMTP
jgi:hypothetical protein